MANKNLTLKASVSLEVKKALSGLGKLQTGIANIGKSLATAFSVASIAMFGRQLINIGKDFEDAMARVKAVSNATVGEFNTLTAAARKMGETTKYTATEAAQALEKLTRNGMKATEAAQALPSVLKLAQANAIELDSAANILKVTMNMFGLSANNAARVSDVLSTTAANTATNIEELFDAMVNVAPAAKVLGFSLEEIASAMGALAQRGVKGAAAGTQLRIGLIKMVDPKINKRMKEMGINIDENTMKAEGLYKTLKHFSDNDVSLERLTDIFSQKGAVGVQQLVNSLDDMQYMMAQIANQAGEGGTTARMFRDGIGSMKKELDTLKSKWESTMIAWSTGTNGPITGVVRFLQNIADLLRKDVGSAIIALSGIWLPALFKAIVSIVNVVKSLSKGINGLKLASLTNWITALIQAVAIAGTAIYGHLNRINAPVKEAEKNLGDMWTQAARASKELKSLGDAMAANTDYNNFVKLLDKIKALFPDLADAIEDAAKRAYQNSDWKEFKDLLEDIYKLQTRITKTNLEKEVYTSLVNRSAATLDKTGEYDWVNKRLKKDLTALRLSKDQIEQVFQELIEIMIKAPNNAVAKKNVIQHLKDRTGWEPKPGDYETIPWGKWIEAILNMDDVKTAKRYYERITEDSKKNIEDIYKVYNESFVKNIQDLKTGGASKEKLRNAAGEYITKLSGLANDAMINGYKELASQYQNEIENIRKEYSLPSNSNISQELKATKNLNAYIEAKSQEENLYKNKLKTEKEMQDAIRETGAKTGEYLLGLDDLNYELSQMPEDLRKAAEECIAFAYAVKQIAAETKAKELSDKAEKEKKERDKDLRAFYKRIPKYTERDTSRDWKLTKIQIADEDLKHLEEYRRDVQNFLDSIDEEELKEKGIFEDVKSTIEELRKNLLATTKDINDQDILIYYLEQLENVDKIIKDIEEHTISTGNFALQTARNFGKQIEQVGSHTISIAQNIDKIRELNGLDPIFDDEAIQKLQAYANILKDLVGIYDAIKKAMEVTAAIDDYRSAQKFKNTLQNIAATQAETAAEKAQAAEAMKVAVAEGAGSVAKTPWIGPALAVAAAAMISTAIISNSKKFATGGIIGYGTSSGDNTIARVNKGEMILNTGQQKNLFNMLNGKGSTGGGEVQFKISGKDLVGVLRNEKLLTTGKL